LRCDRPPCSAPGAILRQNHGPASAPGSIARFPAPAQRRREAAPRGDRACRSPLARPRRDAKVMRKPLDRFCALR
jgi:hypothetical protein